jgi:hypothetical protein
VKSSNKNLIQLIHLTLNSSGQYKCEVSTGAPDFATNYKEGNVTVICEFRLIYVLYLINNYFYLYD